MEYRSKSRVETELCVEFALSSGCPGRSSRSEDEAFLARVKTRFGGREGHWHQLQTSEQSDGLFEVIGSMIRGRRIPANTRYYDSAVGELNFNRFCDLFSPLASVSEKKDTEGFLGSSERNSDVAFVASNTER